MMQAVVMLMDAEGESVRVEVAKTVSIINYSTPLIMHNDGVTEIETSSLSGRMNWIVSWIYTFDT